MDEGWPPGPFERPRGPPKCHSLARSPCAPGQRRAQGSPSFPPHLGGATAGWGGRGAPAPGASRARSRQASNRQAPSQSTD
eukprot:9934798-Alexandrium_andersonii.AAC.1